MSDQKPQSYPPDVHIVRDLAPSIERGPEGSVLQLSIVPEILDQGGRLRVGVAAAVVDIIAGETAIREVLPEWIATSNLSLQVGELPGNGTLRTRPRVLRRGRTTLVMEVDLDHVESGAECGLATIGFSILPSRNDLQARVHWAENPEPRSDFANETSGFETSALRVFEMLKLRGVEIRPNSELRNHVFLHIISAQRHNATNILTMSS